MVHFKSKFVGIFLILFLSNFFVHSIVNGATISGTVIAKAGHPKSFVRVEIFGPQGKFSYFTDGNGEFTTGELKAGKYTIQIIEKNEGTHFTVKLANDQRINREFRVPW